MVNEFPSLKLEMIDLIFNFFGSVIVFVWSQNDGGNIDKE